MAIKKFTSLLICLILSSAVSSCAHKDNNNKPLLDIQKTCRENPKLVEKIMIFSKSQFEISAETNPRRGIEQTWDLKQSVANQYNLKWFQIKFEKGRLQSVWFGKRSTFKEDMKKLGVRLYFVRNKKGEEINTYTSGLYWVKDLSGRSMQIEHDGAPQQGTSVTCFKARSY